MEAERDIDWREIEGVRTPFASIDLLWRTKQTVREKDSLDRLYLQRLLSERGDGFWLMVGAFGGQISPP